MLDATMFESKHILITSGERMGSPYPERRELFMYFSDDDWRTFFEHAWRAIKMFYETRYGAFDIYYIESNYNPEEYCTPRGWGELCPRHEAVFEAPIGNRSNREYLYGVAESLAGYKIYMSLGSGWLIYIDSEKAAIERPSGRRFVYRNYAPVSSYAFILVKFARALRTWEKAIELAGTEARIEEVGVGVVYVYTGMSIDIEELDYIRELERYAHEWMMRWRERHERQRVQH